MPTQFGHAGLWATSCSRRINTSSVSHCILLSTMLDLARGFLSFEPFGLPRFFLYSTPSNCQTRKFRISWSCCCKKNGIPAKMQDHLKLFHQGRAVQVPTALWSQKPKFYGSKHRELFSGSHHTVELMGY